METGPEKPAGRPEAHRPRVEVNELDFDRPLKPIAELLADSDFPKSALGQSVDIGGYTGVVVEIVNQSLKVRTREGTTKSFNANGLRRIYGPRPSYPELVSVPSPVPPPPVQDTWEKAESPAPAPPAPSILKPDFSKPIIKFSEFVSRTDYPDCVLGEHVEINGYTGVVVQIVHRSLKVRSPAEITRSYNADVLRKLYSGQP